MIRPAAGHPPRAFTPCRVVVNPVIAGRVTSSGVLVPGFNTTLAVTGASFSNSVQLYMVGKNKANRVLCEIDPGSGATPSTVDLNGLGDDVVDMDFDSSTGKLDCLLKSTNVIVELNLTSGAVLSQTTLSNNFEFTDHHFAAMAFPRRVSCASIRLGIATRRASAR